MFSMMPRTFSKPEGVKLWHSVNKHVVLIRGVWAYSWVRKGDICAGGGGPEKPKGTRG